MMTAKLFGTVAPAKEYLEIVVGEQRYVAQCQTCDRTRSSAPTVSNVYQLIRPEPVVLLKGNGRRISAHGLPGVRRKPNHP